MPYIRKTADGETAVPYIGFSQFVMNHPFRIANVETVKAAATRAGVRLLVTDAEGSAEVEAQNVRWMLDQGVDALVISSLSGPESYETYRMIADAEKPLVVFASGLPKDGSAVPFTSYVGSNDRRIGQRAAQYIGNRLGEAGGRVMVVDGPLESSNARLRSDGFHDELAASFPSVEITGRLTGDWLRKSAFELASSYLSRRPRVDAVFAENDEMALGVVDALRRWDQSAQTFIVGADGQHAALCEIWRGGPLAMTLRTEFDGDAAVQIALAAVRGESVTRIVDLDTTAITSDNVESFLQERPAW
jgi:ABC-type sugar transport system substrate-binding protein